MASQKYVRTLYTKRINRSLNLGINRRLFVLLKTLFLRCISYWCKYIFLIKLRNDNVHIFIVHLIYITFKMFKNKNQCLFESIWRFLSWFKYLLISGKICFKITKLPINRATTFIFHNRRNCKYDFVLYSKCDVTLDVIPQRVILNLYM